VRLRIVWIGKTKDANLSRLAADYAARVQRFLPLEIAELKDPKRAEEETAKLLAALDASDRVIALDPAGKSWTSHQFAAFIGKHMREDARRLTFVIGGFSGLAETVKKRADAVWSLSPLTFTHDLARVLLLEQLYRALSIIHNHPYSK
jgi:23S rRNA (pseudouridine1915-N3)-methyltransferase